VSELAAELEFLRQLTVAGPGHAIELLLQSMEPESARLLRLCAIPHQFNVNILRVLDPALDADAAQSLYDEFSHLHVVSITPDWMALHDDARRHLFNMWLGPPTEEEFTGASARLAEYFGRRMKETHGELSAVIQRHWMFHLIGADQAGGFATFEDLSQQFRRQFRLGDCEGLINLVHEYDRVLTPERALRLNYQEGVTALLRSDWEGAETIFQAILSKNPQDPGLLARVYNRLGIIRAENRNRFAAIKHFKEALRIASSLPRADQLVCRIYHDLGVAYRERGETSKAEEMLNKSAELARRSNDPTSLAMIHNSLGTLYHKSGKSRRAIESYDKCISYLTASGGRFQLSQVYNNLGLVYRGEGNWKKSEEVFRRSLEIKRQTGDTLGQAKTLSNLITVYQNSKQDEQAIEASLEAIRLFGELHDTYGKALVKRDLAHLYRRKNEKALAIQTLQESIKLLEDCGEFILAEKTKKGLEKIMRGSGSVGWWLVPLALALSILGLFLLLVLLISRARL
jgi:tetratricopeptide (TPR) repeat protein